MTKSQSFETASRFPEPFETDFVLLRATEMVRVLEEPRMGRLERHEGSASLLRIGGAFQPRF